jgi:hypothetical protein
MYKTSKTEPLNSKIDIYNVKKNIIIVLYSVPEVMNGGNDYENT